MFWCLLFIIGFLYYSMKMKNFIDNTFKRYEKYHEITSEKQEKFKPFIRNDYPKWSKIKFYLVAIFMMPLRFCGIFCSVVFLFLCLKIAFFRADLKRVDFGFRRKIVKHLAFISCRAILLFAGFYKIETIPEKLENYIPNYVTQEKNGKAPIIVCNHVSWVDTICMMASSFCPSFLAKEEISHMPIVGFVAKTLQALFVDRDSRSDKDLILQKIGERCKVYKTSKNIPQLLIFPEGTNTNGKSIISFKRGAFNNKDLLQIICLEYPYSEFNLTIDDFGMGFNILLTLCVFKHNLKIHVFDVFDPKFLKLENKDDDWEKIANVVRGVMAKCLNAQIYNHGYRDTIEFTEFLMNKGIIKGRKMNVHNEYSPDKKAKISKKND